ncbi:TetR/AcrR family transcriptional regulator [Planococcus versutus]|uniref:TetR family transcriptional regulator n=1 Tax=Planococcus versutus TaxID=1302659 RepID=A0A1B1S391_9BACL|nr:TetR/AcrR family transcriptional regulator [Planococcus versutus]ANU27656.1 TetR family transcriptional regulator [Planococcus versutus]
MDKKKEIMKQAVHLFSIRGFHQSSVQEIVHAAEISKGAFYKHFESKESLFIEILKQHHQAIMAEILNSTSNFDADNKDVFKQKLAIEIERTLSNHEFFMMVFKDFTLAESDQLKAVFIELRQSTVTLHKTILLDTYGLDIKLFLPDLVAMLEGLMQQYIFALVFEEKQVPIPKIVNFITSAIDAVVDNLKNMEPVLTKARAQISTREEAFNHVYEKMNASEEHTEKLLASLDLLKKEIAKKDAEAFLIEALLVYMKQFPSIKNEVIYLEKFI